MAASFTQLVDDLAYAKTFYPSGKVTAYINSQASKIYLDIYKNRKEESNRIVTFWKYDLPLTIIKHHGVILFSFVVFVIFFAIGFFTSQQDDDVARGFFGDSYVDKTVENINSGAAFVAGISNSVIGYSALTYDIYTAAKSEYFDTVSKMSRKEREELIGGKKVGGTDVDLRILKGEYAKFKKNNPNATMSFDEFLNSQGKDLGKSAIGETTKGMTNNLLDKTTFETNLSWSNEKVFFADNSQ